jgi:putative spermidine/putrescine transport system substrate-binding protein
LKLRKPFTIYLNFVLVVVMLSSCNTRRDNISQPLMEIGPGEGSLDIISWEGYFERGENDPGYDWVSPFENETGCIINVHAVGTSDEMVMLMNQGGFDLATAAGDAVSRLIASGNVQPVNMNLIPSWSKIDPRVINATWSTAGGFQYAVPFQWVRNVLMYDTESFAKPPSSWDVVFIEQNLIDGMTNKGHIQAYEGPIYIADAALYLMNTRPELGIFDPYELDRDQFGEAIEVIRNQRRLVSNYWDTASGQMQDFISGNSAASTSWPYQSLRLNNNSKSISSITPDGGATGRIDSFILHADALHPNCAYLWMEYALDPKIQGEVAAWYGSNPVVPSACEGSELLGPHGCETNGFFDFENVHFWKTPIPDCGNGENDCVPYSDWVTAYISVIGGQ